MRGFLLIEVLLAFSLLGMTMTGIVHMIISLPISVVTAEQYAGTIETVTSRMDDVYGSSLLPHPISSTTERLGSYARLVSEMEDSTFSNVQSMMTWKSISGVQRSTQLMVRMPSELHAGNACDPFVTGNWDHPVSETTYALNSNGLASTSTSGSFSSISDIEVTPSQLTVSAGSTTDAKSPSLFVFSIHATNTPVLVSSFDNASTSRIGYSRVAVDSNILYAANAFGSASIPSCADGSCGQLHIFSPDAGSAYKRISSLTLSTSTAPFAMKAGGATSPATAITYQDTYVFLGLEKTIAGLELNIIDVRDSKQPVWISGYRVGRTITSITIRDNIAYVTTDDPSQELLLLDISDPRHPTKLGAWDAPGSTAFGYGSAATVLFPYVRFGRTYSSNAAEFEILDVSDPLDIKEISSQGRGVVKDPQSVKAMLTQDYITFLLLTNRLEIWSTGNADAVSQIGNPLSLPSSAKGTALTCRNNRIYVTFNDMRGAGFIRILRGG